MEDLEDQVDLHLLLCLADPVLLVAREVPLYLDLLFDREYLVHLAYHQHQVHQVVLVIPWYLVFLVNLRRLVVLSHLVNPVVLVDLVDPRFLVDLALRVHLEDLLHPDYLSVP
jgi:hypothetical protein